MKKIFLIGILFFLFTIVAFSETKIDSIEFQKIKNSLCLDSNDILIIYFHSPCDCLSKNDAIFQELICLKQKNIKELKILLYIEGEREIEISNYKQNYSHIGKILLDKKCIKRRNLGIDPNISVVFCNSNGIIEYSFDFFQASSIKLCERFNLNN